MLDLLIESLPTPTTGTIEFFDIAIGAAAAGKARRFRSCCEESDSSALVQAVLDRGYTADCCMVARQALPRIDAKEASLRLAAVLKNGEQVLRMRAAIVLGEFGADGEASIPALTEMKRSDPFLPIALTPPTLYKRSATK